MQSRGERDGNDKENNTQYTSSDMVYKISIKPQPEVASKASNIVNLSLTLWLQIPQTMEGHIKLQIKYKIQKIPELNTVKQHDNCCVTVFSSGIHLSSADLSSLKQTSQVVGFSIHVRTNS